MLYVWPGERPEVLSWPGEGSVRARPAMGEVEGEAMERSGSVAERKRGSAMLGGAHGAEMSTEEDVAVVASAAELAGEGG